VTNRAVACNGDHTQVPVPAQLVGNNTKEQERFITRNLSASQTASHYSIRSPHQQVTSIGQLVTSERGVCGDPLAVNPVQLVSHVAFRQSLACARSPYQQGASTLSASGRPAGLASAIQQHNRVYTTALDHLINTVTLLGPDSEQTDAPATMFEHSTIVPCDCRA
jgi:hypothetical protein